MIRMKFLNKNLVYRWILDLLLWIPSYLNRRPFSTRRFVTLEFVVLGLLEIESLLIFNTYRIAHRIKLFRMEVNGEWIETVLQILGKVFIPGQS